MIGETIIFAGDWMGPRVDPDIAKILPLLPLKDAASLTPKRARDELVALADSRKDVPLPQPAAVADLIIPSPAGSIAARMYRPAKSPAPTVVFFHGGGWVAGDLYTHDRLARTLPSSSTRWCVSVGYRRPPETRFPGTFEDCLDRHAMGREEHRGARRRRREARRRG